MRIGTLRSTSLVPKFANTCCCLAVPVATRRLPHRTATRCSNWDQSTEQWRNRPATRLCASYRPTCLVGRAPSRRTSGLCKHDSHSRGDTSGGSALWTAPSAGARTFPLLRNRRTSNCSVSWAPPDDAHNRTTVRYCTTVACAAEYVAAVRRVRRPPARPEAEENSLTRYLIMYTVDCAAQSWFGKRGNPPWQTHPPSSSCQHGSRRPPILEGTYPAGGRRGLLPHLLRLPPPAPHGEALAARRAGSTAPLPPL